MRERKHWYVYILASLSGTLYVGVTDNLVYRLRQHRDGSYDGFTKRYQVDRLMYFETFASAHNASLREKQMKKYRREKKIVLFAKSNPQWKDITPELLVRL